MREIETDDGISGWKQGRRVIWPQAQSQRTSHLGFGHYLTGLITWN